MSVNQLAQNPSQAWIWQPITMNSEQQQHHHYYYQHYHQAAEHEQQETRSYGRENMFEKPLTPSDVGKLNRLVIPKQHAEKYFPLDSESGEKGLLLGFEDDSGKAWKFRYSYWTSSQSYVLTKGWSRYVKEKKLDAGDVVFFERSRASGSSDQLYIGCRRRNSHESNTASASATTQAAAQDLAAAGPWSPAFYPTNYYYMNNSVTSGDQGSSPRESATGAAATANPKRLRLFGVNLECGPDPAEPRQLVSRSWNQL